VLEILKLRRLRGWQLRRADPAATDDEVDSEVERELETGEFRALGGQRAGGGLEPDGVANRTCDGAAVAGTVARPQPDALRRGGEQTG
jgi:hypothetical protein